MFPSIAPDTRTKGEAQVDLKLCHTKLNDLIPVSFASPAVVSRIDALNIGQDSEADGPCAQ